MYMLVSAHTTAELWVPMSRCFQTQIYAVIYQRS